MISQNKMIQQALFQAAMSDRYGGKEVIITVVSNELDVPRSTVRRVKKQLLHKLKVLQ